VRRTPTLDLNAVVSALILAVDQGGEPGPAGLAALDATSALLAERGTRGWTVEDVAERAGLGRATVYRRFASRDDLVAAAVARDARRFFAAVADAVRDVEPLEEKVIQGFLQGLRLAQGAPLAHLLRTDPVAAMSLLTSEPLLRAAAMALADRYQALLRQPLDAAGREMAESVAEGLVRLGLSFVLIPGPTADEDRARDHLGAVIRPLLQGGIRNSPRR
jgi:AcrR family transcriptional regulator